MHVYDDYIQTSSPQKLLGQSKLNLCGTSMGRRNESLFAAPGSHYQDGHHVHIWFNPLKTLSETNEPTFTKLGL